MCKVIYICLDNIVNDIDIPYMDNKGHDVYTHSNVYITTIVVLKQSRIVRVIIEKKF